MIAEPTGTPGTTPKRAAKKKSARTSTPKKAVAKRTGAVRPRTAAAPPGDPPSSPAPADPRELRRRWKHARGIIAQVVEQEGNHDPRIWERGAYQLWLWLVVELLVVRRDDIDVGDLSLVSRMLHDQRKLSLDEFKQQQKSAEAGNCSGDSTKLPQRFGELVRQIYGTNFQDDCSAADDEMTGRSPP